MWLYVSGFMTQQNFTVEAPDMGATLSPLCTWEEDWNWMAWDQAKCSQPNPPRPTPSNYTFPTKFIASVANYLCFSQTDTSKTRDILWFILFYMCECFICMCVCALLVYLLLRKARRWHPIPRNLNYRWFWASKGVLGTGTRSSGRVSNALNQHFSHKTF